MAAIRVQLGDVTPMLGSMISGLIGGADDIELIAASEAADVMLVNEADMMTGPATLARIAQAAPIGVVAISADGHSGASYRIQKQSMRFSSEQGRDLLGAIRMAAGRA